MNYQYIEPPDELKPYVRCFWKLQGSSGDEMPKSFKTIADGCPGMILQKSGTKLSYNPEKRDLSEIFLYGQATRHAELHFKGTLDLIGITFNPNALSAIFGLNAGALTDTCIDATLLPGSRDRELIGRLLETQKEEAQFACLSAYIRHRISLKGNITDDAVQHATAAMIRSGGMIPLKNLREELRLSERSLERRFRRQVGITPKLFLRICQFQASLQQLKNKDYEKLSDIAFENEYADQSHLIRSFREFAGFSPNKFHGAEDHIAQVVY